MYKNEEVLSDSSDISSDGSMPELESFEGGGVDRKAAKKDGKKKRPVELNQIELKLQY